MKSFKISVPSNLVQLAAIGGFVLVALTTLGIRGLWPSWVIPVTGAFLGFYSVRDVKGFLLAGLALFAAKWGLGHLPMLGNIVQDFASNLTALVAPAMLVVAIRSIYQELRG